MMYNSICSKRRLIGYILHKFTCVIKRVEKSQFREVERKAFIGFLINCITIQHDGNLELITFRKRLC